MPGRTRVASLPAHVRDPPRRHADDARAPTDENKR
jgi:hypothetical protein